MENWKRKNGEEQKVDKKRVNVAVKRKKSEVEKKRVNMIKEVVVKRKEGEVGKKRVSMIKKSGGEEEEMGDREEKN